MSADETIINKLARVSLEGLLPSPGTYEGSRTAALKAGVWRSSRRVSARTRRK